MKTLAALFFHTNLLFVSCSGYQLGGNQPQNLRHIHTLALPLAKNHTLFPRAEAHLTNAVATALTQDGTYRLGPTHTSHATLTLHLRRMSYTEIRTNNLDTLRSEELELVVSVHWTLTDTAKPTQPLKKGTVTGKTRFFADPNLQTARRNALPDAMQNAAQSLVSQLADGF